MDFTPWLQRCDSVCDSSVSSQRQIGMACPPCGRMVSRFARATDAVLGRLPTTHTRVIHTLRQPDLLPITEKQEAGGDTHMESKALKIFRRKMANPLHWRKANQVFLRYSETDLQSLERTKHLISTLAAELDVPLSPEEKTEAAKWLRAQGINPQSRKDRMMIWKRAK